MTLLLMQILLQFRFLLLVIINYFFKKYFSVSEETN